MHHKWSTPGGFYEYLVVCVQKRTTIVNARSLRSLVLLPAWWCAANRLMLLVVVVMGELEVVPIDQQVC